MKTMKKLVSILLCAVLLLSVMPVVSFSAFSYYALELDETNVIVLLRMRALTTLFIHLDLRIRMYIAMINTEMNSDLMMTVVKV